MSDQSSDFEYFQNKRTDRVYLSKALEEIQFKENENEQSIELIRPFRIISKIIENKEDHQFVKVGKEIALRITPGGRQEIKATFYEDSRCVTTLTIQKYTIDSGMPHRTSFSFQGDEILKIYNFIRNIPLLPINSKENIKFDDKFLNEIVLTKGQTLRLISENPDLINELIENNITKEEIVNLGYRKKQLEIFYKLLNDTNFFEEMRSELGNNKRKEDVWQVFFEKNTWIFGYGLNYAFNAPLNSKKLEQVVAGFNFNSAGKRIDALMKTRGIISSLCFGEIKTHETKLLKEIKEPYRKECWAISDELAGSIAQTQKTVQKTMKELSTKIEIKNDNGELTGENVFVYQPKSFVVIGNLSEFKTEFGINEDKFSSFELYRQNQINPDIITFDELFERASYIVKSHDDNKQ